MNKRLSNLITLGFIFTFLSIGICGQIQDCSNIGENPRDPYPEKIKERLVEMCIERAKKEFQELIDQGEEIANLTREVENSFEKNNRFSEEDGKKLEKVEKLIQKIRKELRADDDDEEDENDAEKPSDMLDAVKALRTKASNLFDELKKTSRYSISAVAIQSSNTVLRLLRFLKIAD